MQHSAGIFRLCLAGLVAAAILATTGCRDVPDGAIFEVSGRIFVLNYRVATANYVITLRPLGTVPDGLTAKTLFENPEGGAPILINQKVYPKLGKLVLESPPVFCLFKDRFYNVDIAIIGDGGQTIQAIHTEVLSTLDQSVLPDAPLVVGPVYTPNPDFIGNPGGKLPDGQGRACPH